MQIESFCSSVKMHEFQTGKQSIRTYLMDLEYIHKRTSEHKCPQSTNQNTKQCKAINTKSTNVPAATLTTTQLQQPGNKIATKHRVTKILHRVIHDSSMICESELLVLQKLRYYQNIQQTAEERFL